MPTQKNEYYYYRLYDDFFDQPAVQLIQSKEHGYEYLNILIELQALSSPHLGLLVTDSNQPHTPHTLAEVLTHHRVNRLIEALQLFLEYKLIHQDDQGVYGFPELLTNISKSTPNADRMRKKRREQHQQKLIKAGN